MFILYVQIDHKGSVRKISNIGGWCDVTLDSKKVFDIFKSLRSYKFLGFCVHIHINSVLNDKKINIGGGVGGLVSRTC